jgi:predicted phosphoribosyltransferase
MISLHTEANSNPVVRDLPALRDRTRVFADRADAGAILTGMLTHLLGGDAIVLAIPAGGVPVGVVIARNLRLPLDLIVVSKITLPWTTESGYGAVAFDGTVLLNDGMVADLKLPTTVVEDGIERTRRKVVRRSKELRGEAPPPDLFGRSTILVDDGLASGITMKAAASVARRLGATRVLVAVPTGSFETVQQLTGHVDEVYCANVRRGARFAVADAYRLWRDVDEAELAQWSTGRKGTVPP